MKAGLISSIKSVYTIPDEVLAIQITPENQIDVAKWLQCANIHVEHDLEHNAVHIRYLMNGQSDLYVEDGWWIVLMPNYAGGIKTQTQYFYAFSPEKFEERFTETVDEIR